MPFIFFSFGRNSRKWNKQNTFLLAHECRIAAWIDNNEIIAHDAEWHWNSIYQIQNLTINCVILLCSACILRWMNERKWSKWNNEVNCEYSNAEYRSLFIAHSTVRTKLNEATIFRWALDCSRRLAACRELEFHYSCLTWLYIIHSVERINSTTSCRTAWIRLVVFSLIRVT